MVRNDASILAQYRSEHIHRDGRGRGVSEYGALIFSYCVSDICLIVGWQVVLELGKSRGQRRAPSPTLEIMLSQRKKTKKVATYPDRTDASKC